MLLSSPEGTVDHPARGAYHLFVGNFSYTLLVAVASIVIARLLGPSDYGLYSLALVVPGYLYTAVQLGFNQAAVYYASRYRSAGSLAKAYEFIYSITLFQLIVAALSISILIPLSTHISTLLLDRPELAVIIPLALITVLGHVGFYTISGGMQGLNRMNWSALLQVLLAIVKLVASVGLVLLGFGVVGAVLGNAAGFLLSGFAGLGSIIYLYRKVIPFNFFNHVKTALTYSIPLYVASLVSGLVGPIQNTFLAIFVINQYIGGYSSAGNLGALITLFVYPIATVLFPLFSSISDDRPRLLDLYRISVRYSTMIIVPITLFLIAVGTPVASAVYGRAYSFAGDYLRVLILPNLLVGFGSIVQGPLLNSVMKNRAWMVCNVSGSVVSVAVSALFVRYIGVYGVIAGSVAGAVVSLVLAWPAITESLGGNAQFRSVWRIYVASIPPAIIAYFASFLPYHPIIVSAIALLLFFLVLIPMLVSLKAVSPEDVQNLDSYFSRIAPVYFLFRIVKKYYQIFVKQR